MPRRPSKEEALSWLESHTNYEAVGKPRSGSELQAGLARVRRALQELGSPEKAFPIIHITGTNGKGSAAHMCAALLKASGLKVGLYTSPDLENVNERIAVDFESIEDDEFAEGIQTLAFLEEHRGLSLSRFEALTVLAFWHFANVAVDAVVLEVGLGGTFDATNVADAEVAVLTNVSLDHTNVLGDTEEQIAFDKAGIVKEKSVPVLGKMSKGALESALGRIASVNKRRPLIFGRDFSVGSDELAVGGHLASFSTRRGDIDSVFIPLHGRHQVENAACSLVAVEEFFGRALSADVVRDAFMNLKIPGRAEVASRRPLVVLDGAHNPAAGAALAATLKEEFEKRPVNLVTGMLADKDWRGFYRSLSVLPIKRVIACEPPSPRRGRAEEVGKVAAEELSVSDVQVVRDPKAAAEVALVSTPDDEIVLITGSLYIVGYVRRFVISSAGRG